MKLLFMQRRLSSAYRCPFMSVAHLLKKYSLTPFLTHDRRGHFHRAMQMWSEETANDNLLVKNTQKYMEEKD